MTTFLRADGVAYLRDAAATVAAFVDAFPPAAALVLADGDAALLATLAALHDSLATDLAALARKGALPALSEKVRPLYISSKLACALQG